MSAAQTYAGFEEREEPGLMRAVLLAFGVHLVLIVILLIGVRWQSHAAAPMVVELWRAPPPAPAPKIVHPAPPKPPPKVVQPPPPPKPAPRIEKPDIAIKEPPKPKPPPPKPEAKPKPPPPKPVAKPEPKPKPKPKPREDVEFRKQMQEQLANEQAAISQQRQEQEMRQLLDKEAASERSKALASWIDKIRAKIRSNIILPPVKGNPEARFLIVLLPTGEVLDVKMTKSSNFPALDDAIDRAIRKSSPLPKPEGDVFERELEITYRPFDEQ